MDMAAVTDKKACAVTGCERPVRCRSVCGMHYDKLLKYGDPTVSRMPTRGMSLAQRLDLYIDKSGGPDACWPWIGKSRHQFGYGQLWDRDLGRAEESHRVAWKLANGSIPKGRFVLHGCDNPPCCNPAHLYVGDQKQNVRESYERGRHPTEDRRGERNSFAKLTDDDVRTIRQLRAQGIGPTELGKRFGVDRSAIKFIISGRTWSHVQ